MTDRQWLATVVSGRRPVLVVAEGLLMYLGEAQVRRLVLQLHETFPGCRLIADVFSRLMARSATKHPSLKYTGATIGWGIDDAHELEAWAPGLCLLEVVRIRRRKPYALTTLTQISTITPLSFERPWLMLGLA